MWNPLNEPKWYTDTLALQLELLWGLSDQDKQGGQRRGLVDKAVEVVAVGVEEFIEQIGEAVTLCEMWFHQGGGGGLSLRIWSSSRSQIRSGQFEGFSAGLNRCCVLWKRQNLQSRLNFIYPWQAQKWWGIKTEIKSNHDRVEALSLQRRSSQIGGKLNNFVRNCKIVSKYLKILQCNANETW